MDYGSALWAGFILHRDPGGELQLDSCSLWTLRLPREPHSQLRHSLRVFRFPVVGLGVLIFGIYVARQRWQSSGPPEELEPEEVFVDREGWETKVSDDKEQGGTKASKDEEGWEGKPEG